MSLWQKFPAKTVFVVSACGILVYKLGFSRLLKHKRIKYIVIDTVEDWNLHEKEIVRQFNKCKIIGIDCEWVTIQDERKPVSLLQLANNSGFCLLIRLSCLPVSSIPVTLIEILRNEAIFKVGVSVSEDVNKLLSDYCLEVRGFLDLRFLAKDLKELQGKTLSLQSLGLELLGVDLNKSKKVRCSDWNASNLSQEQIQYAADDAIIAQKIFFEIQRRKSKWLRWNNTNFLKEAQVYVDIPFKQSSTNNCKKQANLSALKKLNKTSSRPRQKPLYDNCQLEAPDGELLCNCDKGKAEWYVNTGLGEVTCNEPYTVRLKFEPSRRPRFDDVFYTKELSNRCVVCGTTENFHRKQVIPSEYRKYFPNLMKKNLSHDVVLLCDDCHKRSNILDQEMRHKLAELCSAPLNSQKVAKLRCNPEIAKVKSAAIALQKFGSKMTESRQKELKKVICNYYNITSCNDDILQEACKLENIGLSNSIIAHGLKVYQYFCENDGLIKLEKIWRQHFLDSMKPQFLPSMWSVNHNHKRLAIKVANSDKEIDFDVSILGLTPELIEESKGLQL
ncbi:exonuclease 3'-5' domain-containing protein 2 [Trichonephila clavata]|uniref:Exonuclease 3'-5' domain-containing protein 2 n=1 Tax=Trichonephila clavata TaxID=2740835 RepID=A0A8X6IE82_TRICU|nr:exonuclease 3'-5' domain-containing protein 2 [Trichonephila clavata]